MVSEAAVDAALSGVRSGLEADGFRLYAKSVSGDGDVVVCLEALADACLDCLVPDAILEQIVGQAIRSEIPAATGVTLVKEGFDGVVAH